MSFRVRVAALAVLLLVETASAAEHPLRGLLFSLRHKAANASAGKRSLRVRARDESKSVGLVGDPAKTGATLTLVAAGDDRRSQTINLPPVAGTRVTPGWRRTRNGLVYTD